MFAIIAVFGVRMLPVELYAQGSQRSTPQSDLYYPDLTNMFYIRKSVMYLNILMRNSILIVKMLEKIRLDVYFEEADELLSKGDLSAS